MLAEQLHDPGICKIVDPAVFKKECIILECLANPEVAWPRSVKCPLLTQLPKAWTHTLTRHSRPFWCGVMQQFGVTRAAQYRLSEPSLLWHWRWRALSGVYRLWRASSGIP